MSRSDRNWTVADVLRAALHATVDALQVIQVDSAGGLPVARRGTLTNRSVTCSGTAADAAGSNTSRNLLLIQNPTGSGASFWFSTDTTAVQASPSVEVAEGVTLMLGDGGGFVPTGAVSVIGPNGLAATVKEG